MSTSVKLPRTVRGKRPEFFATEGLDEAVSMILVLAQEVAVLRERLDSAERVSARHGIALAEEIEALVPDESLLTSREAWRQEFYERLFYVSSQRRAELEARETAENYRRTIEEIAVKESE